MKILQDVSKENNAEEVAWSGGIKKTFMSVFSAVTGGLGGQKSVSQKDSIVRSPLKRHTSLVSNSGLESKQKVQRSPSLQPGCGKEFNFSDIVSKKIQTPEPVPEKIQTPDLAKPESESSWQEPIPSRTPSPKLRTSACKSKFPKNKTISDNPKKDYRPIEEIIPISEIKISFKIPKKIQILRPEKFSLHQILQNSDDSADEINQPPTLKVSPSGRFDRTPLRRATTIYDEPDNQDLIYTKLLNQEANPIIGRITNTHKNILKTLLDVSKDDMKVTSLYIVGLRLTVFCCLKHLSLKEMIENPLPAHLKSKIINQFDLLEKVGCFSAGQESSAKKKTKEKIILEQITTWGAVVKLMDNLECKNLISGYWEVVPRKKKDFLWTTH
jgi:hypothetical protein